LAGGILTQGILPALPRRVSEAIPSIPIPKSKIKKVDINGTFFKSPHFPYL
jgi:hypothetical protein